MSQKLRFYRKSPKTGNMIIFECNSILNIIYLIVWGKWNIFMAKSIHFKTNSKMLSQNLRKQEIGKMSNVTLVYKVSNKCTVWDENIWIFMTNTMYYVWFIMTCMIQKVINNLKIKLNAYQDFVDKSVAMIYIAMFNLIRF